MNLSIKTEPLNEPQIKMPTDMSLNIENMIKNLLNATKSTLPLSVNTNSEDLKNSNCIPSSSSLSSNPSNDNASNFSSNLKFFSTEMDSSLFDEEIQSSKLNKKGSRRSDNRMKTPKTLHKCLYCDFQTVMSQHMKSHLVMFFLILINFV